MRNSPYRDSVKPVRRAGSTGIVDDMVRQFADPYAFVRELVQNAIDASASAIQVEVRLDSAGTVRSSVTDDGCGMSRQDIESRLLTLFASSKEDAEGKIGKYGIGFLSVLGVEPEEVLVETWQHDASYLVRLRCDLQYVLERDLPREESGTCVTLMGTMDTTTFKRHCQQVRAALLGWCRHASVPIFFEAHGLQRPSSKVCVNEPFDLMAPVKVQYKQGEESLVVGYQAGCSLLPGAAASLEGDASFAGFYNHGLTLFETTRSGLEGMRFKVMSPHLRHTLSRDNVRRDDAYARMLDAVHSVASNQLPAELRKRNAKAANSISDAGWGPEDTAVMVAAATHLSAGDVVLPLLHPIDERRSVSVAEIHRLPARK